MNYLNSFFKHTVTIKPASTMNEFGEMTYGAPFTAPAMVRMLDTELNLQEVQVEKPIRVLIYFPKEVSISERDQIEFNGVTYGVAQIVTVYDELGTEFYKKVYCYEI